jgi:hypothetical protein
MKFLMTLALALNSFAATISVKTYGAVGDGVTDDTAAIRKASNACSGGRTLLFPAGTYKLSGTVRIQSNCSYTGQGFPILLGYQGTGRGGYQLFELNGNNGRAQNVTITGLIFDGGGIFLNETSGDFQQTINNITIRNNIFRNIINSNINSGVFQAAIFEEGGTLTNSSIDHNLFSHIADGGRLDAGYTGSLTSPTGCCIYSNKYGMQIHSAAHSNFNNNVFDWIAGNGIHLGELEQLFDHSGINVQNNIFTRMHRNMVEIQLWQAFKTVVSGNVAGHIEWAFISTGGASFASDGTVLFQNNLWDGWNDLAADPPPAGGVPNPNGLGYCNEIWGTNSVSDGTTCTGISGKPGLSFFAAGEDIGHHEWHVPGTTRTFADNITIKNGLYCGSFVWGTFGQETPAAPYPVTTLTNNSTPASCAGLFPTPPHGLTTTPVTAGVNLAWTASTDNSGIASYNIYRNGDKIAGATGLTYQDTGVTGGNVYWYNVQAVDKAGKVGAASDPALVTGCWHSGPPNASTAAASSHVYNYRRDLGRQDGHDCGDRVPYPISIH